MSVAGKLLSDLYCNKWWKKMGHTWQDTVGDWPAAFQGCRPVELIWMENITLLLHLLLSVPCSVSPYPPNSLFLLTVTLTLFHSDLTSVSLIGRPSLCTNQWHALIIERLTSIGWLERLKTHFTTYKHTVCTYTAIHLHTTLTHLHNLTTYCTLTCSPWGQFLKSKYIYCGQHQLCLLLLLVHWC